MRQRLVKSQNRQVTAGSLGSTSAFPDINSFARSIKTLCQVVSNSFQPFARYRLHADGLDIAEIGLDPSSRGMLVHTVLEQVWRSLKNQNNLNEASSLELQFIESCIKADHVNN